MDELLQQLLDNISDAYDKSAGYIVYDLLKAFAIVMSDYDNEFERLKTLYDVDKLTGALLDTYVYQRKGIERNKATHAIGLLLVVGNGTINKGDLFETDSGIQFQATETKVISGSGTVAIAAILAGEIGNVGANQITQMPVTLSGITSVTNPAPTYDGFAAESDESLRERYYLAVRTPATSGNVNHYKQWATSVAGVGGVKVYPLSRGDNTVTLVIIDQNKQPASAALVAAVQDYIDPNSEGLGYGQAPIGAFCYVESAVALSVNISVTISKDSNYTDAQVHDLVVRALTDYLKSIAFESDYVSYAAVGNVIYNCEGVMDYSNLKINGTTNNVNIGDKQIAVLGGVTIA